MYKIRKKSLTNLETIQADLVNHSPVLQNDNNAQSKFTLMHTKSHTLRHNLANHHLNQTNYSKTLNLGAPLQHSGSQLGECPASVA